MLATTTYGAHAGAVSACMCAPAPCVGTMVASGGYDGLLNVYSDPSKPTPKLSLRVGIYIYIYSTWHLCILLLAVADASTTLYVYRYWHTLNCRDMQVGSTQLASVEVVRSLQLLQRCDCAGYIKFVFAWP